MIGSGDERETESVCLAMTKRRQQHKVIPQLSRHVGLNLLWIVILVWGLVDRADGFTAYLSRGQQEQQRVARVRLPRLDHFATPRPERESRDFPEREDESPPRYTYRERFVGGSKVEQEFRSMPLATSEYYEDAEDLDPDDDLYDNDIDDVDVVKLGRPKGRGELQEPRRRRDEGENYYDDFWGDDNDDDETETVADETVGNFWSNPDASFDPAPIIPRPSREGSNLTRRPGRDVPRKRKRTTFRSGIPEPPPPVSDFYNRLFWYGFDPTDTDSPADKTMFGGTKGKFDGLAYLYDGGKKMPPEERRRRPRLPRSQVDLEDDDYVDRDDEEIDRINNNGDPSARFVDREPYVAPLENYVDKMPSRRPPRRVPAERKPRNRREVRRENDMYNDGDDGRNRRASNPVSKWFGLDDDEGDEDEYKGEMRGSTGPRSGRREQKSRRDQDVFNPFDIFFGMNRETLSRQAEEYNRQMGLGVVGSTERPRRPRNPNRPRRTGYAYRYDADEDDSPPVAEYETVLEQETEPRSDTLYEDSTDIPVEPTPPRLRILSVEERALAIERVPPGDVAAWGPSGDLGVDARSHAMSQAMQDIVEAKRKLEARQAKVDKSREDLSILKVDTELERNRLLRQNRGEERRIQQKLRELDMSVDNAARAFRLALLQLQTAQEELADVEARHWAVLGFFDPQQAESGIEEAFREFEANEPAAARYKEKLMEEQKKQQEQAEMAEDLEANISDQMNKSESTSS